MIEELKTVRDALASSEVISRGGRYVAIGYIKAETIIATLDRIIEEQKPDVSKMVVPDGYKLVPIEPTGPMIMSGIHAHERNDDLPNIGTGPKSVGIYKAMISAAPTPAQPEKLDVEVLKREADENGARTVYFSDRGWNACIDHLAATYDFVKKEQK